MLYLQCTGLAESLRHDVTQVGVRDGSRVMVLKQLGQQAQASAREAADQAERRAASLSRIRAAAEALSRRGDGSATGGSAPELSLESQSGQRLQLPPGAMT